MREIVEMRVHGGRLRRQPDLQFLRLRAGNKAERRRSRDDKPETSHSVPPEGGRI
jgi:hypothetical protein